jgi:hypothetical protein
VFHRLAHAQIGCQRQDPKQLRQVYSARIPLLSDVPRALIATHGATTGGTGVGELVRNSQRDDFGIVSRLVPIGLSDWLRYGCALPRPWGGGGGTVEGREQSGMGANPRKIHLQEWFELARDRLRSPSAAARRAPRERSRLRLCLRPNRGTCARRRRLPAAKTWGEYLMTAQGRRA